MPWPWSPRNTDQRARGSRGEALAARLLVAKGYVLIDRNVRFPVGELDLVARDGQTLCLVEVRSASSSAWGGAAESITSTKRRRIIRAAQWYLQRQRTVPERIRFDVVAIQWNKGAAPSVELIQGAFSADEP